MKARLLFIVCLLSLAFPSFARAGSEHNLSGYAWSSNIGWISFNCTNDLSCGTVDYGVNRNADNTLTGYAWSSNIGWIKFGGLSGFPTGSGTFSVNASVSGNTVVGWARALSATDDGWDGWISLSGDGYGVSITGSDMSGYAWGSDVVGWISFDAVAGAAATLDVKSGGTSIVGNNSVEYGTVPTFVWTVNQANEFCDISKVTMGGTAFSTTTVHSSGSMLGSGLTDAAYTFRIACSIGGAATTTIQDASFTVLPQAPGFSLGSSDAVEVQFISPTVAESTSAPVFVYANQAFKDVVGHPSVTVTISGTPTLPASTTMQYSFDDGLTYGSAASRSKTIVSDYSQGFSFRVKVTRLSGAPEFIGPYTVTLSGAASGYPTATKDILVSPSMVVPRYEEL
ncbi:MAG TPA: hypothetical protein VIR98_01525 [Candidatus Paceibacterota bacterium]|jgi:hypothetical protein